MRAFESPTTSTYNVMLTMEGVQSIFFIIRRSGPDSSAASVSAGKTAHVLGGILIVAGGIIISFSKRQVSTNRRAHHN